MGKCDSVHRSAEIYAGKVVVTKIAVVEDRNSVTGFSKVFGGKKFFL
jgi:hypothetical protein